MRLVAAGAAVISLLILGSGSTLAAATPTVDCAGFTPTETYDVAAEARQDAYPVGETALVDVAVTDSLTGLPAEGIRTGVFMEGREDWAVFDHGRTNQRGHVLLKLRLKPKAVDPGWAHVFAIAWEPIVTPVYCTSRYGWTEYPKLFRITR